MTSRKIDKRSEENLFPEKEYLDRVSRLQNKMHAENISAILINWRPDLFYFTGTAQQGHCIISAEDYPRLLVRRDFNRAKDETWVDSVHQVSSFREVARYLIEGKGSRNTTFSNAKLGLELDVVPAKFYLRLKRYLPTSIEIIDCSPMIRDVRSRKSQLEIKLIEKAAEITRLGHEAVVEALRPGISESEVCAIASKTMLDAGHQGFIFFRAWNNELLPQGHCISGENGTIPSYVASPNGGKGPSSLLPQGSSNKKIKRNEPILVDLVGCYQGYCADETRTYWIGSLPELAREQLNHGLELEQLTISLIKPNKKPSDIYQQVMAHHHDTTVHDETHSVLMASREGIGFLGHGVGLEIDEWPVISASFHLPFQEGNTIAIEPKIRIQTIGLVGIENTYVLSNDGMKRLTNSPLPTE